MNIKIIIITYIVVVIIQILVTSFVHKIKSVPSSALIGNIDFNNAHRLELEQAFSTELTRRIKLLDTMSYYDWIEYNNNNSIFKFEEHSYYIFGYERTVSRNKKYLVNSSGSELIGDYVLRISADETLINLSWSDEIEAVNYRYLAFEAFPLNEKLINDMWNMSLTHGARDDAYNSIAYYWENPLNKTPIKKLSYITKFTKQMSDNTVMEGVLGMGFGIEDLTSNHTQLTYEYCSSQMLTCISIMTFIMSIVLYYINDDKIGYKPIAILIMLNIYFTVALLQRGAVTTIKLEEMKLADLGNGILGISFLVAVNIFILQSLDVTKKSKLIHYETAFLFCCTLIFLLISCYKQYNYATIEDMRSIRIRSQIFFNLAIITNIIIFINYLLFLKQNLKK